MVHAFDPLQHAGQCRAATGGPRPASDDDDGSDSIDDDANADRVEAPMDIFDSARPGRASSTNRVWRDIFGWLTEMMQPQCTRYDHGKLVEARIDRIYTSLPGWAFLASHARTWVVRPAYAMDRAKISDHTLVQMTLASKKPLPLAQQPLAAPSL